MAKWSWQARFRHCEEACFAMDELDDMPSWDDLTLEQALDIMEAIMELNDEDNGCWDFQPECKRIYMQAKRFIEDFGGRR